MAKKKKGSKTKGVKGKKAREKAKLDRRWGEEVSEEVTQKAKFRKGKSRLIVAGRPPRRETEQAAATSTEARNEEHDTGHDFVADQNDAYSTSSDGSAAEFESAAIVGNEMETLLKRVNKSSPSSRPRTYRPFHKSDSVESDDASDDSKDGVFSKGNESGLEIEIAEEETFIQEDDDEGDSDDDIATTTAKESQKDPYKFHFSKPALPENSQNGELDAVLASSRTLKKVLTPHLNSQIEVQLSGHILEQRNQLVSEKDKNPVLAEVAWDTMASEFFAGTRKVLVRNWKQINREVIRLNADGNEREMKGNYFSALQATLYPALASYLDALITVASRENRDGIEKVLSLHILNHVLTACCRVQKHNRRMKELSQDEDKKAKLASNITLDEEDEDRWRDQGYTRPKVLVILPTRGTCLSFVKCLLSVLGESVVVDGLDRFEADYGMAHQVDQEKDDDVVLKRRKAVLKSKGADWQELFGDDVNDDDEFKIGIAITPNAVVGASKRKKSTTKPKQNSGGNISVKLYSYFYRSDIILTSPLGLKMTASGTEEDETVGDFDFLSSIEVCLVCHSDVLLMQNWDHVNSALESLNHQPKKNNDTDFARVRNYLLAGQAAHWRQLIVVSRFSDAHILASFKRHAQSIAGRIKLRRKVLADEASICNVSVRTKQVFQRVSCQSIVSQGEDRLHYLSERILPQLMRLQQKHTLIYISSYFDFVSIRNLLLKREASFVSVTEYARGTEVSRGRAHFLQGRKNIMLYTGRAHFFLRHTIKGARHIILFGLPEHAEFYPNLTNMLSDMPKNDNDENSMMLKIAPIVSCLSVFTKYDAHSLERIVGTLHCERMVKGEKNTYLFCSSYK